MLVAIGKATASRSEVDWSRPPEGPHVGGAGTVRAPAQPLRGVHDHPPPSVPDEAHLRRTAAARPVPQVPAQG